MTYKLTTTDIVIRLADGANIPADPANTDRQAFERWVAAGNTPEPADPVVPAIPQSVTRFQARAALHLAGLLEQVEGMIADPATPVLARLAWQDAQEFKRTSPTIAAMSSALGLTEQQLDEMFITAAGIDA